MGSKPYLVLVLCIVRLSLITVLCSYLIVSPPPLFPENGVSNKRPQAHGGCHSVCALLLT
jgi:hypothetical protein